MSLPRRADVAMEFTSAGDLTLAGLPLFAGDDHELMVALDTLRSEDKPSLIVTANVDQCLDLARSQELWAAYGQAALRTLDGMPLVWLAKVIGARRVYRQTGADMLTKCVEAASSRGWRVVILGGASDANALAVGNLNRKFPKAEVRGLDLPFATDFSSGEVRTAVAALTDMRPDVVFLCLGSPKQEKFYVALKDSLPPAIYIGAGAAVDFASGGKARAPKFVQNLGLEWTWRLVQEPRRLARRYLVKGTAWGQVVYYTMGKK